MDVLKSFTRIVFGGAPLSVGIGQKMLDYGMSSQCFLYVTHSSIRCQGRIRIWNVSARADPPRIPSWLME